MAPRNVRNVLVEDNDLDMERTFTAMAAFPTLEEASGFLIAEHGMMVSPAKLDVMRRRYPDRFERARTQAAKLREQALAGDLLDGATFAVRVEHAALRQAMDLLERGGCKDPGKLA